MNNPPSSPLSPELHGVTVLRITLAGSFCYDRSVGQRTGTAPVSLAGGAALLAALSALSGLDRDECISYLVGLRHWSGQTLYQSFFIPHGPVAGMVFAFFLRLMPTGGWALVAASASLNAAAAITVWRILRKAIGDDRAALAGGWMTAFWFVPVFGAFYHDHLAYFWGLLALAAWQENEDWGAWIAGILIALCFHTKQTVGLSVLAAFVIGISLEQKTDRLRKQTFLALKGLLLCHALIFLSLWAAGLSGRYWLYNVIYPWRFARLAPEEKGIQAVFSGLLIPFHIQPLTMIKDWGWGRLAFYPIVIAVYLGYASMFRKARPGFPFVVALFSTVLGAALLGRLHAHLFFGMAIVIVFLAYRWRWSPAIWTGYAMLGLAYTYHLHGHIHPTDPFFSQTDLRPIRIATNAQSQSSEVIVRYLESHPSPFALLGDASDLISLALRKAPWNPSVNFTQLTIPADPDRLEQWQNDFLNALFSHEVRQIVVERKYLVSLPKITDFLKHHCREVNLGGEPLLLFTRVL